MFKSHIKLHYSQTIQCRAYRCGRFKSPIKLHYSQTQIAVLFVEAVFKSPIKLHYSQTPKTVDPLFIEFKSPIKLHYSQTPCTVGSMLPTFKSPIKLHYSQTSNSHQNAKNGTIFRGALSTKGTQTCLYQNSHRSASTVTRFSRGRRRYPVFSIIIRSYS